MASERNGSGGGEGHAENGNGSGGGVSMEMPEIRFTKLFINGTFVDAVSGTFRLSPLSYTHMSVVALAAAVQIIDVSFGYGFAPF
jgi:hypothetical protein